MRIGGYAPCSLSDFPGRLAAVVFTQGCNWRCPWCHNPTLVYPEQFGPSISVVEILARLARRRGRLDGVVVSGGEPTLQAGLADFFRQVRAMGFATKLDTNGSHPEIVKELLTNGLLDLVAMDIKAPWSRYDEAAGATVNIAALQQTLSLLRDSGVCHQLRTTRWPALTTADCATIDELAAGSPHVWQEHRA